MGLMELGAIGEVPIEGQTVHLDHGPYDEIQNAANRERYRGLELERVDDLVIFGQIAAQKRSMILVEKRRGW